MEDWDGNLSRNSKMGEEKIWLSAKDLLDCRCQGAMWVAGQESVEPAEQ